MTGDERAWRQKELCFDPSFVRSPDRPHCEKIFDAAPASAWRTMVKVSRARTADGGWGWTVGTPTRPIDFEFGEYRQQAEHACEMSDTIHDMFKDGLLAEYS